MRTIYRFKLLVFVVLVLALASLSGFFMPQAVLAVARADALQQGAPVLPDGFVLETVVGGLALPTAVDWLPDGRMLVAEKGGVVRVVENGTLLAQPFIDISDQVNQYSDRGLLDIAVHPNFLAQPYIYLLYVYDPPQTATFSPPDKRARFGGQSRLAADARARRCQPELPRGRARQRRGDPRQKQHL